MKCWFKDWIEGGRCVSYKDKTPLQFILLIVDIGRKWGNLSKLTLKGRTNITTGQMWTGLCHWVVLVMRFCFIFSTYTFIWGRGCIILAVLKWYCNFSSWEYHAWWVCEKLIFSEFNKKLWSACFFIII